LQSGLSYENGRIQININTSGTPVKVPYDPKQIENTMIKSNYTNKMDMSQLNQSRGGEDEKEDMKMTQSEYKAGDAMLASVNKSMMATKEPEMVRSQDGNTNANSMAVSLNAGQSNMGISLKIPDPKKK
jgi:hypothetical protein